MQSPQRSSRSFALALPGTVVATVCAVVAMIRYPGGTVLDHATANYSLTHNFLSDLGMTVAYNGVANKVGAALFVAALCVLVIVFRAALVAFVGFHSQSRTSRNLALAAVIFGHVVALSFVGVAFTPENALMATHVQFTLFAFKLFPVVPMLFAIASYVDSSTPPRITAGWIALTGVLLAYAAFLQWGAPPTTANGLVNSVLAQKAVTISAVLLMLLQVRNTQTAIKLRQQAPANLYQHAASA